MGLKASYRSARSRLNKAILLSEDLTANLERLREDGDIDRMSAIRVTLNNLIQCVHECNAYENAYQQKSDE